MPATLGRSTIVSPRRVRCDIRASTCLPVRGSAYGVGAIDPHLGPRVLAARRECAARDLRSYVRRTAAAGSAANRFDSRRRRPVVLAPETADDYSFSYERGGPTQIRLTYYVELEKNRIDVLPFNFRANSREPQCRRGTDERGTAAIAWARAVRQNAAACGSSQTTDGRTPQASISLPITTSTQRRFWRGISIRPDMFPISRRRSAYEFDLAAPPSASHAAAFIRKRLSVWQWHDGMGASIPRPARPILVPNDNLRQSGLQLLLFKESGARRTTQATNPYVATLGTNEGADPNTLRTPPQTLASLHVELDLSPRVTAILDVVNLFATAAPTQLQGNPYLIGPPGYRGRRR